MKSTDNKRYRIVEYAYGFCIEEEMLENYWTSVDWIAYSSFDKAYQALQGVIERRNIRSKYPIVHWESK